MRRFELLAKPSKAVVRRCGSGDGRPVPWFARLRLLLCFVIVSFLTSEAIAADVRIPLHDGRVDTAQLTQCLVKDLHLPDVPLLAAMPRIDVRGLGGCLFIQAIDRALGPGCSLTVSEDALIVHVDPSRLPHDLPAAKRAARVFTEVLTPQATAQQQRQWGLAMPDAFDPDRPLVVLIHGLDGSRDSMKPLGKLIAGAGYQVGYFSYPGDGPLDASAERLGRDLRSLLDRYPHARVDVVAFSMGGLVARAYIEGDQYAGGVRKLILIAPPNHGSHWASFQSVLTMRQAWDLVRCGAWNRLSWVITDGLGEAATDLAPDSAFLRKLDARPRRSSVQYTIICGSQNLYTHWTADALDGVDWLIPRRAAGWWPIDRADAALNEASRALHDHTGTSDGPVTLSSAELAGVGDVVVLPVDHNALYRPADGDPPAAWPTIQQRLDR